MVFLLLRYDGGSIGLFVPVRLINGSDVPRLKGPNTSELFVGYMGIIFPLFLVTDCDLVLLLSRAVLLKIFLNCYSF
jgi:hypothetical protein